MIKASVKSTLVNSGGILGTMAGTALGGGSGGIAGGTLGSKLGAKLSRLIGSGDYTPGPFVKMNSLVKNTQQRVELAGAHSIRFSHREYISDIISPSASPNTFTLAAYPINAGLGGTFPYLSQIANLFEQYKFHGLVFEYVSTTSPYNATSAMGSVILTAESNAFSANFSSKQAMENSDFAVSVRPDASCVYGVELDPSQLSQNTYYVRSGPSTLPLTTTDVAEFMIATQLASTFPLSSTLGELWVSYDVELSHPRLTTVSPGYAYYAVNNASVASPLVLQSH